MVSSAFYSSDQTGTGANNAYTCLEPAQKQRVNKLRDVFKALSELERAAFVNLIRAELAFTHPNPATANLESAIGGGPRNEAGASLFASRRKPTKPSRDSRAAPRKNIARDATLSTEVSAETFDCTILNISETGCRISMKKVTSLPNYVRIMEAYGAKPRLCRVAWNRGAEVGLNFIE